MAFAYEQMGTRLSEFLPKVIGLTQSDYVKEHPMPVLVLDTTGAETESGFRGDFVTLKLPEITVDNIVNAVDRLKDTDEDATLLHITKANSQFTSIVTLGRAPKNDLRIDLPSVSKFHCYFTYNAREKIWHISDAYSANGTFLDEKRLDSNQKVAVSNGAILRFGSHARAQFFEAEFFFEYLRQLVQQANSSDSSP